MEEYFFPANNLIQNPKLKITLFLGTFRSRCSCILLYYDEVMHIFPLIIPFPCSELSLITTNRDRYISRIWGCSPAAYHERRIYYEMMKLYHSRSRAPFHFYDVRRVQWGSSIAYSRIRQKNALPTPTSYDRWARKKHGSSRVMRPVLSCRRQHLPAGCHVWSATTLLWQWKSRCGSFQSMEVIPQ